jgi:hypothetical protein
MHIMMDQFRPQDNNRRRGSHLMPSDDVGWVGPDEADYTDQPWSVPVPLRTIPAAAPFPPEVFPEPVRRFVQEVSIALPCPVDYVAVPALVAAGAALGKARVVQIKPGHEQHPAVYGAVVGEPGSLKSPAQDLVTKPLHDIGEEVKAQWDARIEKYEEALEDYDADKKAYYAARKAKKKPEPGAAPPRRPQKPERPVLERVVTENATVESLVPILRENPRGVLLAKDELAGWVLSSNQYKAGKGNDRQFFLSVWAGADAVNDRSGTHLKGPKIVRKPLLGIVGGLVPSTLPILRGDSRRGEPPNDGFFDRILPVYPAEYKAAAENWMEVSDGAQAAWRGVIDRLRELEMEEVRKDGGVVGYRPHFVRLTSSGRQAWLDFTRQHAAAVNSEEFPPHLRGPWSKLKGYCARLALILHYLRLVCGETSEQDVDGESMRRAIQVVDYFKSHARKVYSIIDADPKVSQAGRLLHYLAKHPDLTGFTRTRLYRHLRGQRCYEGKPEALDAPLALLREHGYLRCQPAPRATKPGPKPDVWHVHPDLPSMSLDPVDAASMNPDEEPPDKEVQVSI